MRGDPQIETAFDKYCTNSRSTNDWKVVLSYALGITEIISSARIRKKQRGMTPTPPPSLYPFPPSPLLKRGSGGFTPGKYFYFHIAVQEFQCIPAQINYFVLRGFFKNLIVRPDPENMCIAVGLSLCIEADIYVMSYLFPVNGRHMRFTTHPDFAQYSYLSLRVA